MASYSASLLEAWNPNLRAYSTSIPSGEVRIKHAPLMWALAALSTDKWRRSDASWAVSVGSAEVNSMMKSAKIFPFDRCSWLIPNVELAQLYAHFISLPEVSGLCNICFIGCYVGILIVWAWKYGRSLPAIVTNARTSFSIFGYLSSTLLRARLQ